MDKKGAIKVVVGITILLVFLVAVLISFFCPDCLGPAIAKGAEKSGDSILGGLRGEKFEKLALEVDEAVEETYDDLIKILRQEGDGPCLLEHKDFADDFRGNKIMLEPSEEGIFAYILNKKEQRIKPRTIVGKVPCVVAGDAALNFNRNFLDGSICGTDTCEPNYVPASIVFEKKNKIIAKGDERDMKDGNLVFKAEDGNVCFFPTWGGGCSEPKEREVGIGDIMKEDCFKRDNDNSVWGASSNIKLCSELSLARAIITIGVSGIDAYYQIDETGMDIRWSNPADGSYYYLLYLKKVGETNWNILNGNHPHEHAEIVFSMEGLDGTETLTGQFKQYYSKDNIIDLPEFTILLSDKGTPTTTPAPGSIHGVDVGTLRYGGVVVYDNSGFSGKSETILHDVISFDKGSYMDSNSKIGAVKISGNCRVRLQHKDSNEWKEMDSSNHGALTGDFESYNDKVKGLEFLDKSCLGNSIKVYKHKHLHRSDDGGAQPIIVNYPDLRGRNFGREGDDLSDDISSARFAIEDPRFSVTFCKDEDYKGDCTTIRENTEQLVGGFEDEVTSISLDSDVNRQAGVILYKDSDFKDKQEVFISSDANLEDGHLVGKSVSSLKIVGQYKVTLYEQGSFVAGRSLVHDNSGSSTGILEISGIGEFNDKVKSIKIELPGDIYTAQGFSPECSTDFCQV